MILNQKPLDGNNFEDRNLVLKYVCLLDTLKEREVDFFYSSSEKKVIVSTNAKLFEED